MLGIHSAVLKRLLAPSVRPHSAASQRCRRPSHETYLYIGSTLLTDWLTLRQNRQERERASFCLPLPPSLLTPPTHPILHSLQGRRDSGGRSRTGKKGGRGGVRRDSSKQACMEGCKFKQIEALSSFKQLSLLTALNQLCTVDIRYTYGHRKVSK